MEFVKMCKFFISASTQIFSILSFIVPGMARTVNKLVKHFPTILNGPANKMDNHKMKRPAPVQTLVIPLRPQVDRREHRVIIKGSWPRNLPVYLVRWKARFHCIFFLFSKCLLLLNLSYSSEFFMKNIFLVTWTAAGYHATKCIRANLKIIKRVIFSLTQWSAWVLAFTFNIIIVVLHRIWEKINENLISQAKMK